MAKQRKDHTKSTLGANRLQILFNAPFAASFNSRGMGLVYAGYFWEILGFESRELRAGWTSFDNNDSDMCCQEVQCLGF